MLPQLLGAILFHLTAFAFVFGHIESSVLRRMLFLLRVRDERRARLVDEYTVAIWRSHGA